MPSNLEGVTAVVTGGGSNFGEAIAEGLARAGAYIGIYDLDAVAAAQVAARLRNAQLAAHAIGGDVANTADVKDGFAEIERTFGPIDVLVNNAGIASTTPITELTREEWDRTMAVDLTSLFICTKAVMDGMIQRRKGSIINVASLAGKRGGGILGKCAYATAKAGVLGFTKAAARELAQYGIRVNSVAPGAFDTGMSSVLSVDVQMRERVLAEIPLGRLGRPEDVSNAVLFLASDDSAYITGETIVLDGGILME